jgi:hypothetical protein
MRELKKKGVKFTGEVTDERYGLLARFRITDAAEADLYQPRYERKPARAAAAEPARPRKSTKAKAALRASRKKAR